MRTLLFGVDGLTFRILNPLMERGLLPNFQRVRDGGVQGILKSTTPPLTPPAWTSISTGLLPAKHGVFDFWDFEKTPDGLHAHVTTHRRDGKAIWNILSEWGKQVVIANVPVTYPPEPVNGIMLSGYMAPGIKANVTFPTAFKDELLRAVPDYQIELSSEVSNGQNGDPLSDTLKLTRGRLAMFRLLLEKPWDFFYIVFVGADRIQHLCWDEIMAFHERAVAYYQMLDEALGLALGALRSDDILMIVSDHGFQGASRKFYMQEYLHKQGLLRLNGSGNRLGATLLGLGRDLVLVSRSQRLARLVRQQLRRYGVMPTDTESQPLKLPNLDWARTRAYLQSSSGAIAGYADIVMHESMTDTQIQDLAATLQELRDPQTGQLLISAMYREDVFGSGPFAPRERHLILISSENILLPTELGRRALWETGDLRAGIHHPDGVLFLHGANVKRGVTIDPMHVCDVVPTLLSCMGLPLPGNLDGRMMEQAFEQSSSDRGNGSDEGVIARKLRKITAAQ